MLLVARESNYWYVWPAMEIAYLCRMRLSEVPDLTDVNELLEGLLIKRRKGSRDKITEWNPRLRSAWDFAVSTRNRILAERKQPHPIRAEDRHIIVSERTGDKIVVDSLKTAMGRITVSTKKAAEEMGVNWIPFTFHGKRSLNHAIDFQTEVVAVYAIFGSTSCQGSNTSKSSTVLARGN